ncbi:MAG: hypothetical protein ACRD2G_08420 [Terriglobia bacterium]
MAANRQQGNYLATFLIAFVALTAGLVELAGHSLLVGVILTLAGLGIFAQSLLGFRRIKSMEHSKEQ